MLLLPERAAAASTSDAPVTTACTNCGVDDHLPLLIVRHRGTFRRLCATCVLRLHPQSFCPICFQVYPPPPPNGAVLTCFKCYSSTHSHCVASPPSPYICSLCLNPNTPIFKLKTLKEANAERFRVEMKKDPWVMDRDAAKKLAAAAQIVRASMNKAAMATMTEAERRAKEAALARKRGKEGLEYEEHMVMKENLRKKQAASLASSGSGLGRIGGNVVYTNGGGSVGLKENPVIAEETMKTLSRARADDVVDADEDGRSTENAGDNAEGLVDWSDVSDIEQMLFSDEDADN